MTEDITEALSHVVTDAEADAAVLLRLDVPGTARVTAAYALAGTQPGDVWPACRRLTDAGYSMLLLTKPGDCAAFVPTSIRLVIPEPVSAVLVVPVPGSRSRVLLLWFGTHAPADTLVHLESAGFRKFSELAPLMESQVHALGTASRLRVVVESLEQAVVILDEQEGKAEVNLAAAGLLGIASGEVEQDELAAAMRALRERSTDPVGLAALAERLFVDHNAEIRDWLWSFDGSPSHLRVNSLPLNGPSLRGRVWVFDDISAQMGLLEAERSARDAANASEQRYRLMVENASDIVFHSVEGVVEWISPSIEAALGRSPEQIIGSTTAQYWHPDDLVAAVALRERVYGGTADRGVFRFRHMDGHYLWVEVAMRPTTSLDGRRGAVGLMHDVTDRVAAESAARESETRYRLLAENASDVVFQGDNRAVITWASPSVRELLGRPVEAFIGHSVLELIDPVDIPVVQEASRKAASGERVTYRARYRRADGELRWCEVTARPTFDAGGAVVSRVGSLRDVHDQVTAELALVESEREARRLAAQFEIASMEASEANHAKTAFLSRISHELRTPLNAVLGFAQLLAMDPLTEDQREAVQHIRTGGKHLLELINEILDISRIEAGRLSLSMERVDVGNALGEALDLVRPLAIAAGVNLAEFDKATGAETVWADRQRVIQIVLNLLTNAVKYNRVGGSITVTCERLPDGMVAIRVHDTGHGISEEYLARLFQPFDRLGAETSSIEGTGIGLTLSEGLARAMSGRIDVESVVGVGSVFSLLLPSATLTETETQAVATPLPSIFLPGRVVRIQYIEDNPANLLLMTRIVSLREGATLRTATGGCSGLAMVLADPPDLLLLDVHLQDLRGDEVLRQLRADPRTVDVPIVVVTADASAQLRQRMMVLGASGFLTKPIEVREVLRWIDDPQGGQAG